MDRSPPHRRRWRGRAGATALSGGLHGALLLVLLIGWRTAAPPAPQLDIPVSLAPALAPPAPPPPAPAPKPAAASKPAAAKHADAPPAPTKQRAAQHRPPLRAMVSRRSPAPPTATSLPAVRVASRAPRVSLDALVDAQISAARGGNAAGYAAYAGDGAGSGQGGGVACDMTGRVQAALRKDPLARAAVHAAGAGRSILIWNGDWVQSGAEDGKGLAAVREAITWEVAFAPAACRRQRMRGPVLLSLNDGSPQVELVAGEWRWSDLLGLR